MSPKSEAVPEKRTLRDEANQMSKEQQLRNLDLLLCAEQLNQGGKRLLAQEAVEQFAAAINLNQDQLNNARNALLTELDLIIRLVDVPQTVA